MVLLLRSYLQDFLSQEVISSCMTVFKIAETVYATYSAQLDSTSQHHNEQCRTMWHGLDWFALIS
jgi:hypothetical protein